MKIIRIIVAAAIAGASAFTFFFGAKKIGDDVEVKAENPEKQIITVWQIDSFEGGSGSRRKFLLDAAKAFEKKHKDVLVTVVNYTTSGAEAAFKENIRPDLVSYGNGLSIDGMSEISLDRKTERGKIGDKQFAAVWCRGAYMLFENPDCGNKAREKIVVSQAEYTLPLAAYALDGNTSENLEILSPMNAYVKFVGGNARYLLGTQRDAVRLKNRGFTAKATVLKSFSDLNQFISLTSSNAYKSVVAERFINFLLSDEIQEKLSKINMFSPYIEVNYDEEPFREAATTTIEYGLSAFITKEQLTDLRNFSYLAAQGNQEGLINIKKVLL